MISDVTSEVQYRVLLIEDDLVDQEIVARSLDKAKEIFSLTRHECLQDGVEALRLEDHDLILLDLSLPDSYGMQTVARMIEEFNETPIIVLSGSDDKKIKDEAVLAGAEDFLVKGSTSTFMLSETVAFVINLHRSSKEINA